MRKLYFIFLLSFFSPFFYAQVNLVPNPSFETYTTCPSNTGEIFHAIGWDNCAQSSDYYNPCAASSASYVSSPKNFMGFQPAFTGNSYAGIFCYISNYFYREIFGRQLSQSLTVGQKYFVSFKANLALEYSGTNANSATNRIGAKFTKTQYSLTYTPAINNSCHVTNTNFISDTLNWTNVFGSFIADSAYKYIMIGNFYDDINTQTIRYGGSPDTNSYYFIDDVCVSTDSLFALAYATDIKDNYVAENCHYYPNPFDEVIIFHNQDNKKITVRIYDQFSQIVYSKNIERKDFQIETASLASGFYYIEIISENKKIINKIIKR